MIKRLMTCLLAAAITVASTLPAGSDNIQSTSSANPDISEKAAASIPENTDSGTPTPPRMRTIYLNLDLSREARPDDKIYYAAHRSTDETSTANDISGRMGRAIPYEKDDRTWHHMVSVTIPEEYDQIRFSAKKIRNTSDVESKSGVSALFTIPDDLKSPCLYLDNEDPSIYENIERSGTWMETGSVRYPEKEAAEKGNTLTEIPEKERSRSDDIRYLPADLYDDYSDQELNGIPKSLFGEDGMTNRSLVPFRIFDMTLSDAYQKTGAIPLYTGHFQPDDGQAPFSRIAPLLNLYGWENPKTFFAVNNSLLDANGENHPQNYASASQGLVSNELSEDKLMDSSGKGELPYFDKTFLRGANSRNAALGQIYEDVDFPFTRVEKEDGTSVWRFDSAKDHVHLMRDGEGLYLGDPVQNDDLWSRNVDSSGSPDSSTLSDAYGFFPFNDLGAKSGKNYNFGFGAKIGFDFYLPEDGIVTDTNGKVHPVTFSFSGDDDVWVFIDGRLALDVGGDHGKVEGDLDFHDLTAHVSSVKQSQTGQNMKNGPQTTPFTMDTQKGRLHRLTMYYLERGMWESNLKVEYSLSPKPFEPKEEPTPEVTETPRPERPTPEPAKTPAPESTKESIPDPTEEPGSVPSEIPEPAGTPTPEPTEQPTPEQTEDSSPTKTEETPVLESEPESIAGQSESPAPNPISDMPDITPDSSGESLTGPADRPMPEIEENSESGCAEQERVDSAENASSAAESIEEAMSVPEIPSTDNRKTRRFTANAGGKNTGTQISQPKTTKTSAVKTGDVPLKAIIIPILSGLLTLCTYLRKKHKDRKK